MVRDAMKTVTDRFFTADGNIRTDLQPDRLL